MSIFFAVYINNRKMGDNSWRSSTVQDFVRNFLNAVTSLQSGSTVDNRSVERSCGVEFNSVSDEISARFRIPRQAIQARGNTRTTSSNRSSSSTATSCNFFRQATYNPRLNYSQTKVPAGRRASWAGESSSSSNTCTKMYVCCLVQIGITCHEVPLRRTY